MDTQDQPQPNVDYTIKKPWEEKKSLPVVKGTELFIGNLNIDTIEGELYNLFSPSGIITDIRMHKNPQTKKCYAFIRYQTKEDANSAMSLNGTTLKGRKIKVTKSNENSTIFIGNIRKTWTNEEVETKIRRIFHNVAKIEYFPDPNNNNRNRGFCFAIFNSRNEAIKALNYVSNKGGINIDGIPLTCDWADVVDDDDSNSKQIFLSGVTDAVDAEELKNYFIKFGTVHSVILSKNHLNSKRKDLAFITFDTHDEAANAVKGFQEEKKEKKENLIQIFKSEENLNLISISLAFSQQAMQTKKKIKDSRKKITQISNRIASSSPLKDEKDLLTSSLVNNPLLNTSINATQLLAMMNLITMNKNNPNLLSQMMTTCLNANRNSNINKSNNKKFLNKKRHSSGTSPSLPFTNNFSPLTSSENIFSLPQNLTNLNQFQTEKNN